MKKISTNLLLIIRKIIENTFGKLFPITYARCIGVKIGKNCRLINVKYSTEPYLITLGDHVSATKVHFETHDGGVWCFRDQHPEIDIIKPITIGNNVYIGYGSVILPGVEIGNNVVIGACSLVTRNIPSNSVAAGIPAKVIKSLDDYYQKSMLFGEKTKLLNKKKKKIFYLRKYNQ